MSFQYEYPRAAITTDAIILRPSDSGQTEILLIQRAQQPFQGMWALPGGFLDMDETLEQCVEREVQEETGLTGIHFRQAGAYSAIDRDPRHRTITIAFWGWAGKESKAMAGSDSQKVKWFSTARLPALAFDHELIITNTLGQLAKI